MFTKFKENLKKAFLFLVLFSIGVLIFISLLSFNQSDNSFFSYDSKNTEYENFFGISGSFLSSFLLEIFGKVSYLIPFFLIFHSFRVLINKKLSWYNLSSLPFSLITSCIVLEIFSEENINFFLNGGLLGQGLANYIDYFFGSLVVYPGELGQYKRFESKFLHTSGRTS